jgi:hypothetical protein
MKLPAVLGFTALTFCSWGVYAVLLHHGQKDMARAMLKPFVFVGIAYFFIAVLFPGAILSQKGEKGHWSFGGVVLSFLAGSVGALGALGVILALNFGGKPAYVMPFVFGFAPVVNTLVTTAINKSFRDIKFLFVVGLVFVILGAVGVLAVKNSTPKAVAATASATSTEAAPAATATPTVDSGVKDPLDQPLASIFSMILAAFCWGAYGPVLHIGQMKMGGSRMRPFCCVGLAYFFIAVVLPLIMLQAGLDRGQLTWSGSFWSLAAGTAGAIGALGIIYAFNFGGKPIFVMPLVFGFAPVVNTIVSLAVDGTLSKISPLFVGALATTIAGAVMVLVFQPKAKPHAAASKPSTPAPPSKPAVPESEQTVEPKSTPSASLDSAAPMSAASEATPSDSAKI